MSTDEVVYVVKLGRRLECIFSRQHLAEKYVDYRVSQGYGREQYAIESWRVHEEDLI